LYNKLKNILFLCALITPLLVIYGVWYPVLNAFSICDIDVREHQVLASQKYPEKSIVQKLTSVSFGSPLTRNEEKRLIDVAENLLRGYVTLENYENRVIKLPFDSGAVYSGNSSWQLAYSSYLVPRIFLDAYIKTGRADFLHAAHDFILSWESFERDVWSPESFVWNDHAVAARISVLADFWYYYKDHPDFTIQSGTRLITMAARQASFLARDINYTFKTNHGTMQNIAILKAVLYFPKINEIQALKNIAIKNLLEQYRFFINEEGIVLEHSAEYHAFGLSLISATFKLFNLLDEKIPTNLNEKYKLGLNFLKSLRRPDGGLPKLGDTVGKYDQVGSNLGAEESEELVNSDSKSYWHPTQDFTLKPAAGYAIWWSGLNYWPDQEKLAQTAISWSFFSFMGHKHADELSFNLWKGGQEWWSSVGYWPYTDHRREAGVSWTGSNAPHLVDEPSDSQRKSIVLSYSDDNNLKFIDLVRQGPGTFKVRRQILQIEEDIWITLDFFEDELNREGQIVWGLHPGLRSISTARENSFRVVGGGTSLHLDVFFQGSDGINLRKVHGSQNPIAGWVASGQKVLPSDAFLVRQHSNGGWVATVSIFADDQHTGVNDLINVIWTNPEEWSADIKVNGETLKVSRSGFQIFLDGALYRNGTLEKSLNPVSQLLQSQKTVAEAYFDAELNHGKKFFPYIQYRKKVTVTLILLFFLNSSALFLFRRRAIFIRTSSIVSFGCLYYWLLNYYFTT